MGQAIDLPLSSNHSCTHLYSSHGSSVNELPWDDGDQSMEEDFNFFSCRDFSRSFSSHGLLGNIENSIYKGDHCTELEEEYNLGFKNDIDDYSHSLSSNDPYVHEEYEDDSYTEDTEDFNLDSVNTCDDCNPSSSSNGLSADEQDDESNHYIKDAFNFDDETSSDDDYSHSFSSHNPYYDEDYKVDHHSEDEEDYNLGIEDNCDNCTPSPSSNDPVHEENHHNYDYMDDELAFPFHLRKNSKVWKREFFSLTQEILLKLIMTERGSGSMEDGKREHAHFARDSSKLMGYIEVKGGHGSTHGRNKEKLCVLVKNMDESYFIKRNENCLKSGRKGKRYTIERDDILEEMDMEYYHRKNEKRTAILKKQKKRDKLKLNECNKELRGKMNHKKISGKKSAEVMFRMKDFQLDNKFDSWVLSDPFPILHESLTQLFDDL